MKNFFLRKQKVVAAGRKPSGSLHQLFTGWFVTFRYNFVQGIAPPRLIPVPCFLKTEN